MAARQPSDPAEERIRAALRAMHAGRDGRRMSYRELARQSGLELTFLTRFVRGARSVRNTDLDRYMRQIAAAWPENLPDLIALSLAWLPDAARARVAVAVAPEPASGEAGR